MTRRRGAKTPKILQKHASRRARERYGFALGAETRRAIIKQIRSGCSTIVVKQSLRVSVHDVVLEDGCAMRVVYDRHRKEVVTVLGADWVPYGSADS